MVLDSVTKIDHTYTWVVSRIDFTSFTVAGERLLPWRLSVGTVLSEDRWVVARFNVSLVFEVGGLPFTYNGISAQGHT